MRVVGIFAPPPLVHGARFGENSSYRAQGGAGHMCQVLTYATEEPGKVLGRDPVGIVEGTSGCGVSIRGNSLVPAVQE